MDPRETPCERVTRRVAEETDTDVLELPPLFDAVDPDGLNDTVATMEAGEVTFAYAGRTVTVTADGDVRVSDDAPTSLASEGEASVGQAR
ncbi:hypothetical protein GCM10027435_29710 [Haloparvum alkalitolerans]|uniref:HalOD1 output domain-containing protein n=1 Tax=Haloparvum alkalitolerans TaxID=1042953 RepID=UPI003CEF7059